MMLKAASQYATKFYILLISFQLFATYSFAQNVKRDLQDLKKIQNAQEYIKAALSKGESYLIDKKLPEAKEFFREAEKKGKSLGGQNAQGVVSISICDLALRCCFSDQDVKSYLFEKIEGIIAKDKKKLFYLSVFPLVQAINKQESDPQYLSRLYKAVTGYGTDSDIANLKSGNAAVLENAQLKSSLEAGSNANDILRMSLDKTTGALTKMSEVSDSMSGALNLKDAMIRNVEYKLMMDSIISLRREDLLAQQLNVIDLKQKANDRMRLALISLGICLLAITFFLYKIWNYSQIIKVEKARSEELLLNILPAEVAKELKEKGKVETRYYDEGTIMFLDIVGFSHIAKERSPKDLVADLNECFMALDELTADFGIEKIKTIGDAYMCVSGILVNDENSASNMVNFSFEIMDFLAKWNARPNRLGLIPFEARIGIHTGPLAAGVVGKNKFCFDVWGDTVNIASRLEAGSEPGEICISESTKSKLAQNFEFEEIGLVNIKNMAPIEMYFVHKKG